jgi:hypothetical protein
MTDLELQSVISRERTREQWPVDLLAGNLWLFLPCRYVAGLRAELCFSSNPFTCSNWPLVVVTRVLTTLDLSRVLSGIEACRSHPVPIFSEIFSSSSVLLPSIPWNTSCSSLFWGLLLLSGSRLTSCAVCSWNLSWSLLLLISGSHRLIIPPIIHPRVPIST